MLFSAAVDGCQYSGSVLLINPLNFWVYVFGTPSFVRINFVRPTWSQLTFCYYLCILYGFIFYIFNANNSKVNQIASLATYDYVTSYQGCSIRTPNF